MKKRWKDAPSPCVGVCKFRGPEGWCAGCTMTKSEKKRFKRFEGKAEKKAFFRHLVERLAEHGNYRRWSLNYRRRCAKKDVPCPLDRLEEPVPAPKPS